MAAVTIPNDVVIHSGGGNNPADLMPSLSALLIGVGVLPDPADTKHTTSWWIQGTPSSVAILESGATALSKGWTVLLGALGGATAITATVSNFWKNDLTGASRVAAVGGVALIIVAVIMAITCMVVSDVKGRARGAAALYDARRDIVLKFLELADAASGADQAASGTPAQDGASQQAAAATPAPTPPTLSEIALVALTAAYRKAGVNIEGGGSGSIAGIRHNNGEIEIGVNVGFGNTDWRKPSELELDPHIIG